MATRDRVRTPASDPDLPSAPSGRSGQRPVSTIPRSGASPASGGSTTSKGIGASGTLGELPLAHALVYIRHKKLSGVFDLRAPEARHGWMVFSGGQLMAVTTAPMIARFAAVVHDLGFVDDKVLDETNVLSNREKRPQAELLVERGVITQAQYREVIAEQMRRRVEHLFSFPPEAAFVFRDGRATTTSPDTLVDVLSTVWRGIKERPPMMRVHEILGAVGSRPLRVPSTDGPRAADPKAPLREIVDLVRHELSRGDLAICDALMELPCTLADLRKLAVGAGASEDEADLFFYFLLIARCVEPEGPGKIPAASGSLWIAQPAVMATAETELALPSERHPRGDAPPTSETPSVRGPADVGVEAIRQRAASIHKESPFEALGVPDGSSIEAVRAAFFRLRRVWRPDRLPPELESVRSEVSRIFAHMRDAHRMLTDPPRNV